MVSEKSGKTQGILPLMICGNPEIENKNKREITPDNTVISATAEVKTYYTSNITAWR